MRKGTKVTTTTKAGRVFTGRIEEAGETVVIDCGAVCVYAAAADVSIVRETAADVKAAAAKIGAARLFVDEPSALCDAWLVRSLVHGGRVFTATSRRDAERKIVRFGVAQLRIAKTAAGVAAAHAAILFPTPEPAPLVAISAPIGRNGSRYDVPRGYWQAQADYDRRSARGY